MKIKQGFVLSQVGGNTVAVATGELSRHFAGVVVISGCGEFLWKKLSEGITRDELIAAVLEEYDVEEARASADVDKFIAQLAENKMLDE